MFRTRSTSSEAGFDEVPAPRRLFLNGAGARFWVKFHLKTRQGIRTMTNAEGEQVIAKDRESARRDLYESIERGEFPQWELAKPRRLLVLAHVVRRFRTLVSLLARFRSAAVP